MKRLTTEEFIQKYKNKFGEIYDFSKTKYINNKTEIIVTCPLHGDFKKRPDLLMDGGKCPKCSKTSKTTESDFIKKAKYVHNNFFDYKEGTFINVSSKVGVICPVHGTWYPKANNHLNGANCPMCSKEGISHKITKLPKINKTTKKYDTNTLIEKIIKIYDDKYNLDKLVYVNNNTSIIVGCKIHGDFLITPNHLLHGRGCPKCSHNYHYSTDEVLKEFKNIHGDKYSYEKVKYCRTHDDITVVCPIHGDFIISPSNHLKGQGCPKCKNSKLESEVMLMLDNAKIKYNYRERKLPYMNGLELDFYLPEYNIGIECQGIQHFKPIELFGGNENFERIVCNDNNKKKLCEENGIKLLYYSNLDIEYPYKVIRNVKDLLKEILK